MSETFKTPTYTYDEPNDNFLRVILNLPGLETKKNIDLRQCMPKVSNISANGDVQMIYQASGFTFRFDGTNKFSENKYFVRIKDLPFSVNSETSKFIVKPDAVHVWLRKAQPGKVMNQLVNGLTAVDAAEEAPPPYQK